MIVIPPEETYGNERQRADGIHVIETAEESRTLAKYLLDNPQPVGFDTETTGVNPKCESPVGRGTVECWSLAHPWAGVTRRYFLWWDPEIVEPFIPWLESSVHPKVGHNIWGFDRHVVRNMGVELRGIVGDTQRMARFWKTDKAFSVGLKSLMYYLWGYELGSFADLFSRPQAGSITTREKVSQSYRKVNGVKVRTTLGLEWQDFYKTKELIPLRDIPTLYPTRLRALYDYASLDAKATLEIYEWLCGQLEQG